jgi:hypothetical protein
MWETDIYKWVSDAEYHKIICSISQEAKICLRNRAYTACLSMVGSLLEGLIIYSLTRIRVDFSPNATLDQLITLGKQCSLLPPREEFLGHALRNFRNFLHPTRQREGNYIPTKETAELAVKTCEYMASELQKRLNSYLPNSVSARLLVVTHANADGEVIPIHISPFSLGRGENNSYVISEKGVSVSHTRILYQKNSFFLEDLKSTNGTYIITENSEEKKLKPYRPTLMAGTTRFRLGNADDNPQFIFQIEGEERTVPT